MIDPVEKSNLWHKNKFQKSRMQRTEKETKREDG